MNTYIIVYSDELNHYGVKGMRWGVRKQLPFIAGNKRKTSSTGSSSQIKAQKRARAKKIAIGMAAAAAVAGISYAAIKTHQTSKYNKAAHEAVNRALRARKQAGANVHTLYDYSTKRTNFTAGNVKRVSRHGTVTGNSRRLTKMGAAEARRKFYSHPDRLMKDAPSFNGMGGPGFRTNQKSYNELRRANRQLQDLMAKTPESSWNRYSRNTINKLSRPKKKRYF